MRSLKRKNILSIFTLAVVLPFLAAVEALAAEEAVETGWRGTWDEIMLWLNFCILAVVIVKYGRKPLMDFLRGRKEEVEKQIGKVEKEKSEIDARIRETRKTLEDSSARFENMKQRIIKQGERKKEEIIGDAKQQSEMMMVMAKQKIGNRILDAKNEFRAELVDAAVDLAEQKLSQEVTEEDNRKILEQYLSIT